MQSFSAGIRIIGVNPYVLLPPKALSAVFAQAGKDKGPIPVRGKLNTHPFKQTLVKYQGAWRLYLNTPMRRTAGIDVGDTAHVKIEFDPISRVIPMNPALAKALAKNKTAQAVFDNLAPYRKKEILRYLGSLKTKESLERNVKTVIHHLLGKKTNGLYALMRRKE
jgi:hypothetical protein